MNAAQAIDIKLHVFLRGPADGLELRLAIRNHGGPARIWVAGQYRDMALFGLNWIEGESAPEGRAVAVYRQRRGRHRRGEERIIIYDFCGFEQPEHAK